MMPLPRKFASFTLTARLGSDGVSELYAGVYGEQGARRIVARRMLPWVLGDAARLSEVENRIYDLAEVRHPLLAPIADYMSAEDDRFLLEEAVRGVSLDRVIHWCQRRDEPIPNNILLNLAVNLCNALDALHQFRGSTTGSDHVLHQAVRPENVYVTFDGGVALAGFGLLASPTAEPVTEAGAKTAARMAYCAPEQTYTDAQLAPHSDIFSLAAVWIGAARVITAGPPTSPGAWARCPPSSPAWTACSTARCRPTPTPATRTRSSSARICAR